MGCGSSVAASSHPVLNSVLPHDQPQAKQKSQPNKTQTGHNDGSRASNAGPIPASSPSSIPPISPLSASASSAAVLPPSQSDSAASPHDNNKQTPNAKRNPAELGSPVSPVGLISLSGLDDLTSGLDLSPRAANSAYSNLPPPTQTESDMKTPIDASSAFQVAITPADPPASVDHFTLTMDSAAKADENTGELNLTKLNSNTNTATSLTNLSANSAASGAPGASRSGAPVKRAITFKFGGSRAASVNPSPANSRPGSAKKQIRLVSNGAVIDGGDSVTSSPALSALVGSGSLSSMPLDSSSSAPIPPTDPALLHDSMVTCHNCENVSHPVHNWCLHCFTMKEFDGSALSDSSLPSLPLPALCSDCDSELHQFAKSASHHRPKFQFYGSIVLPSLAISTPLLALECSQCRSHAVAVWCFDHRAILCDQCNVTAHADAASHRRARFKARFAHAECPGANQSVDSLSVEPPVIRSKSSDFGSRAAKHMSLGIAKSIASSFKQSRNKSLDIIQHSELKESEAAEASSAAQQTNAAEATGAQEPETKSAEPPVDPSPDPAPASARRPTVSMPPLEVPNPASSLSVSPEPSPLHADSRSPSGHRRSSMFQFPASSSSRPTTSQGSSTAPPKSPTTKSSLPFSVVFSTPPAAARLNPGESGDVLIARSPLDAHAPVQLEQLQFKNLFNLFDTLGLVQIVSISCGQTHAAAISSYGSLFTFGSNTDHVLGVELPDGETHTAAPQLVRFPSQYGPTPIASVALGHHHTLALDQAGRCFAWGSGLMGVLGSGSEADQILPKLVELPEPMAHIAVGPRNSGCIPVSGRCYFAWGEGSGGAIGDGSLSPHLRPVKVEIHDLREQDSLSGISFGSQHAAIVSTSGLIWTFGNNKFGQCGLGKEIEIQSTPRRLKSHELLGLDGRSVHCGDRHTSVISSSGELFSFGSAETHQLGILDNEDHFAPVKAESDSLTPIRSFSVGASVSMAVNQRGELYAFGYGIECGIPTHLNALKGHYFQAAAIGSNEMAVFLTGNSRDLFEWNFTGGPLDKDSIDHAASIFASSGEQHEHDHGHPILNSSLRGKRIVQLSAGRDHFGVVTIDGKLYLWGLNEAGQLGLGASMSQITFLPFPRHVHIRVSIAQVKCAIEHTLALSIDGNCYSFGRNEQGRLGLGENVPEVFEPTLIDYFHRNHIVCKEIAVSEGNSAAIDSKGRLFICGSGSHGQCGDPDGLPHFEPYLVSGFHRPVTSVSFGRSHVLALCDDGSVYTFGENRFHQLGLGLTPEDDEEYVFTPTLIKSLKALNVKVTQVEAGDNCSLALSEKGEIWGFGQADTHQLCRGVTDYDNHDLHEDISVPTKLVFPFSDRVLSISVRDINCACLTEKKQVWLWGWEFNHPTPVSIPPNSNPAAQPNTDDGRFHWDRVVMGHSRMLLLQSESRVTASRTILQPKPQNKQEQNKVQRQHTIKQGNKDKHKDNKENHDKEKDKDKEKSERGSLSGKFSKAIKSGKKK